MIAPRRDRRDAVLLTAKSISESVERWPLGSELFLTADLNSQESVFDSAQAPSVFERRLAGLIDRWVQVLTQLKSPNA